MVHLEMIQAGLGRLGIACGDTLFVHSSLSSFGKVTGGANTVIDALLAGIGDMGNLVFPSYTFSFPNLCPPYHPLRTAGRVGMIPEFFRFRPGVQRSRHPSHAVAALGPQAKFITGSHQPADSPCGRNSPFGPLFALDARVVYLGCTIKPNTTLHAVEDWADLPYITERQGTGVLIDDQGNLQEVTFPKEPGGHRDFYREHSKIEQTFRRENIIRETSVKTAGLQLITLQDIFKVTFDQLLQSPDVLLCDDAACTFCGPKKAALFEQRATITANIERLKSELW